MMTSYIIERSWNFEIGLKVGYGLYVYDTRDISKLMNPKKSRCPPPLKSRLAEIITLSQKLFLSLKLLNSSKIYVFWQNSAVSLLLTTLITVNQQLQPIYTTTVKNY